MIVWAEAKGAARLAVGAHSVCRGNVLLHNIVNLGQLSAVSRLEGIDMGELHIIVIVIDRHCHRHHHQDHVIDCLDFMNM